MKAESADHRERCDPDEGGADEPDTAWIPSSLEGGPLGTIGHLAVEPRARSPALCSRSHARSHLRRL